MRDAYEDMLYREVLERLKAVEKENLRLKEYAEGLRSVLAQLQADHADLKSTFFKECDDVTHHIKKLYKYESENQRLHAELDDWVIPLVEKVFPEWRLGEILHRRAQHRKKNDAP